MKPSKITVLILFAIILQQFEIQAFADCWQVGTCKAKSLPYANITFSVDQCSDLTETALWAKEKRGLLIKEKDKEEYSVIWHEGIQSPEVEYIECDRGMEQG